MNNVPNHKCSVIELKLKFPNINYNFHVNKVQCKSCANLFVKGNNLASNLTTHFKNKCSANGNQMTLTSFFQSKPSSKPAQTLTSKCSKCSVSISLHRNIGICGLCEKNLELKFKCTRGVEKFQKFGRFLSRADIKEQNCILRRRNSIIQEKLDSLLPMIKGMEKELKILHALKSSDDSKQQKTYDFIYDLLKSNMLKLEGKSQKAMRWSEYSKDMSETLRLLAGPRVNQFFNLNVCGPSERTIDKRVKEICHFEVNLHSEQNMRQVLQVYYDIYRLKKMTGDIFIQLSEDDVGIIPNLNYNDETDELEGSCGLSSPSHCCAFDRNVIVGNNLEDFKNSVHYHQNAVKSPYARAVMLNPLNPHMRPLVVAIFPTCLKVDHKIIITSWIKSEITFRRICQEENLPFQYLGTANDGNAVRSGLGQAHAHWKRPFPVRQRSEDVNQNEMHVEGTKGAPNFGAGMMQGPSTLDGCVIKNADKLGVDYDGFTQSWELVKSSGMKLGLRCHGWQDTKHVCKLLLNHCNLFNRILQIGDHPVTMSQFTIVRKYFPFSATKIEHEHINGQARQNVYRFFVLCSLKNRLFMEQLHTGFQHIEYGFIQFSMTGVIAYTDILRRYALIFFSEYDSAEQRIKSAYFCITVLRYLRADSSQKGVLKTKFFTRETYQHTISSCFYAILLMVALRDFAPTTDIIYAFKSVGSDCCEALFRACGGNCIINRAGQKNFTIAQMKEFAAKTFRFESLRGQDKIQYQGKQNRKQEARSDLLEEQQNQKPHFTAEKLSNKCIVDALQAGENEAISFVQKLGLDTTLLKLNYKDENYEREDINKMLKDTSNDLKYDDNDDDDEEGERGIFDYSDYDAEIEQERILLSNRKWPEGMQDGVEIDMIRRDGHCFMRSILHELQNQNFHTDVKTIRDLIASYIENEWEHRNVDGIFGDQTKDKYVAKIKNDLWGGEPEIVAIHNGCLNNLVENKKILIDVYHIHRDNVEIIDFFPRITGEDRDGRIHVVLLYVGGNHFHRIISPNYEIYSSVAFSSPRESHEILSKQVCEDLDKAIRNSKISFEKRLMIVENLKDREVGDNEGVSLQESMIIEGGGGGARSGDNLDEENQKGREGGDEIIDVDDSDEENKNELNRVNTFHNGLLTRDPQELLNGLQIDNGVKFAVQFQSEGAPTDQLFVAYPVRISTLITKFTDHLGDGNRYPALDKIQKFNKKEHFIAVFTYECRIHWVQVTIDCWHRTIFIENDLIDSDKIIDPKEPATNAREEDHLFFLIKKIRDSLNKNYTTPSVWSIQMLCFKLQSDGYNCGVWKVYSVQSLIKLLECRSKESETDWVSFKLAKLYDDLATEFPGEFKVDRKKFIDDVKSRKSFIYKEFLKGLINIKRIELRENLHNFCPGRGDESEDRDTSLAEYNAKKGFQATHKPQSKLAETLENDIEDESNGQDNGDDEWKTSVDMDVISAEAGLERNMQKVYEPAVFQEEIQKAKVSIIKPRKQRDIVIDKYITINEKNDKTHKHTLFYELGHYGDLRYKISHDRLTRIAQCSKLAKNVQSHTEEKVGFGSILTMQFIDKEKKYYYHIGEIFKVRDKKGKKDVSVEILYEEFMKDSYEVLMKWYNPTANDNVWSRASHNASAFDATYYSSSNCLGIISNRQLENEKVTLTSIQLQGYKNEISNNQSLQKTHIKSIERILRTQYEANGLSRERDSNPCRVCRRNDNLAVILLCDHPKERNMSGLCDAPYHIYCLNPELLDIPEGDWYCPDCSKLPALPPLLVLDSTTAKKCGTEPKGKTSENNNLSKYEDEGLYRHFKRSRGEPRNGNAAANSCVIIEDRR